MPDTSKGEDRASTGPKTAHGKKNSSQNAFKHGFFSSQLARDENEKAQLTFLRIRVFSELQPQGVLEEMAVEDIVASAWKLKKAYGLDQQAFGELLGPQPTSAAEPAAGEQVPADAAVLHGLQNLTPTALRHQLKVLDAMVQVQGATLPEELVEEVRATFGSAFVKLMNEWKPVNTEYLLIKTMQLKKELYPQLGEKTPKPPGQLESDAACSMAQEEAHREGQKAQLLLMRQLLVAALQEAQRAALTTAVSGHAKAELALRISAAAKRDLRRAIELYHLVKNKSA